MTVRARKLHLGTLFGQIYLDAKNSANRIHSK